MNAKPPNASPPMAGPFRVAAPCFLMALLGLSGAVSALAADPVQVFAEFSSAAGEAGVRQARLWVDGQEVTGAAAVSPIRISYALPGDFPTGPHEARVVVVDSLGRSHEKSWSFEVSEQRPEVVAFFTDRLVVVLDPVPRQTFAGRVSLSGVSLPEVEIELRREGVFVARTLTGLSGRFTLPSDLVAGENDLTVVAQRPWTGEEGREVRLRLRRLDSSMVTESSTEPNPRETELPTRVGERGGPELVEGPTDRSLPGGSTEPPASRRAELPPAGEGRGGRDLPDLPEDRKLPDDEVDVEVVITKPGDGEFVNNRKVTVLGRAPAGWRVTVRVNGVARANDRANPAGHFTLPQVRLDEGQNVLVAEAEEPGTQRLAFSEPVMIEAVRAVRALVFTTPLRRNQVVRDSVWRLEGRARPEAELEVEVNGRLVVSTRAGFDGRFVLFIPLERGLNRVFVESFEVGRLHGERSPLMTVRLAGAPGRGGQVVIDVPPLERPGLLGQGKPSRLRPLD